jgi:small-conductance mechanosensitive channel
MNAIAFDRLTAVLETRRGLVELGLLLGCVALAWIVDHLVARRFGRNTDEHGGRITFGAFPITLLLLVVVARAGFARSGHTFFLDVAIPLAVALAIIRMLVYVVRRLFAHAEWVKGSERAIAFVIWAIVALHYLGVTAEVNDMLEHVVVPLGKHDVSLFTIGQGFLVVLITVTMTLWLSGFLEKRLMSMDFDVNTRVVLAKFLRAFLVVLGVLISLPAIGIDLTLLSVFGGALGVGIGLGLQKLAANYIAGFAILLDKSIKLGDMVTVDGKFGTVIEVTSRYVVVRSLDGIDAIVPNETLVTTTVLNHSLHRHRLKIAIPVQVAHGADVERALALLVDAARAEPRVIRDAGRAPEALVVGFGEAGVNLELGVWIADPENGQGNVRSAILVRALASFAEVGIALPTTQRDVRVLGAPPPPRGPASSP